MYPTQTSGMDSPDSFGALTERELIGIWRSFRSAGLSERQAWDAIVAGIAFDIAFSDRRNRPRRVH